MFLSSRLRNTLLWGTAIDPRPEGKPIPKFLQPLEIRVVVFPNRIRVRLPNQLLSLFRRVPYSLAGITGRTPVWKFADDLGVVIKKQH